MDDLDFLDILTIASSIIWFKTLDEIDEKLNWIINKLKEDD